MAEIEPKFHVGDRVRIRTRESINAECHGRRPPCGINDTMLGYSGDVVTIKSCRRRDDRDSWYRTTFIYEFLERDKNYGRWYWSEQMLEPEYAPMPVAINVENLTSLWE